MAIVQDKPPTDQLKRRIFQIEQLAAMPQVVFRLMEVLGNERSAAEDVRAVVEADPALASKVLQLANSAYYGVRTPVTTLDRAVVVIGFRELQFLALGAGLSDVFDLQKAPPEFDGQDLWIHCLAAAWTARELAGAAGCRNSAEIMAAALLHDLGKLVLASHLPRERDELLDRMAGGLKYSEAEDETGLHHTAIGYWLARRWELPGVHAAVIRDHHAINPAEPEVKAVCLTVLADQTVKKLGLGLAHDTRTPNMDEAYNLTGLTPDDVRAVAARVAAEAPRMLDTWRRMLDRGQTW